MNVLQWPETSMPSSTSFSCDLMFSGRMRFFSWIGMIAYSSVEQFRLFEDKGLAVDRLQPSAIGTRPHPIKPQDPPGMMHGVFGGREVRAQVGAALGGNVV